MNVALTHVCACSIEQEADGQDETIIPLDYEKEGQIVDDQLHEILVAGLPQGVRLTAIMDCCHSGSVLDLPYTVGLTHMQLHFTSEIARLELLTFLGAA